MELFNVLDLFVFFETGGPSLFLRFFWYAFIFEFPRYVLLDLVFFCAHEFSSRIKKPAYERARAAMMKEQPLVSIIVPGRNEGKNIYKLVMSLQEQTYKNVEIIVVDDGSDDHTRTICEGLEKAGLIDRYLRNEVRGGKASAANLALRFVTGNYILHLDADSSFDRDAVENIFIPFYMDAKIGAVGGNLRVRNAHASVCTGLQMVEYLKTISVGRAVASMLGIYRTVPGAFGAFKKEVLDRVDGWDVGPGLDGDITVKARKMGYRIHFEPRAVCFTNVPETYRSLYKQRLRWYKSIIRFRVRKHNDVFLPTANFNLSSFFSFVENVFFNLILDLKWIIYVADIMYHFPGMFKYIFVMNYVIYLCFNIVQFVVAVALSNRWRDDIKYAVYLPLQPVYYGVFIRVVRTIAYIKEIFFRSSYKDPWNPWKVSRKALQEKL